MQLPWRQKRGNQRIEPQIDARQGKLNLPRFNLRLFGLSVLGVATVGGMVAAWVKLMDPSTLPVRTVQLEAPFLHVTREEIFGVLKPVAKGGFFNVDVERITGAVESLPWVHDASVRRVWPDTLRVTVVEQRALARWSKKALVNEEGQIFSPSVESFPDGLVELQGPESTVALMAREFAAFKGVLAEGQLQMKRVTLSPRRAWQIELMGGETVLLGREEARQRLQRFVHFYPQMLSGQGALQLVDMRYPNGFALKWQKPLV